MKSTTAQSIYSQTTQLFQNKSEAVLLKKLVKACFLPSYVYQKSQPMHIQEHSSESGPSFMKDKYTKPVVLNKSMRMTTKAFVSKRLNYNICEKLKKEIHQVRSETQHIHKRLQSNNIESVSKDYSTTKISTRPTTNRSMAESELKRALFKIPL